MKITDQKYSIGEVASRAGVATSTLRYYESIGLLTPAERVNGRRRYAEEALDRLMLISAAQAVGFTLAEVGALFDSFPARTPLSTRWRQLARAKRIELDRRVEQINRMRELLAHLEGCSCADEAQCAAAMRSTMRAEETATVLGTLDKRSPGDD